MPPPKKAPGSGPREDPQQYVLKKNYKKAIELYRALVKEAPNDANQGLRLADCLVLDGQNAAAVEEYKRVAALYAEQGFLLKAIGVNKKVVKLDPAQEGVHQNLSKLYEERGLLASPGGGAATVSTQVQSSAPARGGAIQFDMEEASASEGMELDLGLGGGGGAGAGRASPAASFETADVAPSDAGMLEPPEDLEPAASGGSSRAPLGRAAELDALDELDAATLEAVSDLDRSEPSPESLAPDAGLAPAAGFDFGGGFAPAPAVSSSGGSALGGFDFGSPGPASAKGHAAAEELSVDDLGDALADLPAGSESAAARAAFGIDETDPLGAGDGGGAPVGDGARRTPLFSDFTAAEFVEVVKQMGHETFPKGTVIVREGDPGDAVFVIVTGSVRVVTRSKGRELELATLHEGDFFGEGSLITGKPRTATIIASEDADLLSLSRASLDEIAAVHPRVRDVMKQFYLQRAENTVKAILGAKK